MQLENNTLYYIYDPMCSWCYAFEKPLKLLRSQLPASIQFKAILGGLAADTSIPMPAETQTMVQQAWQQIENTIPYIRFNFDFWTQNTPYRSTYPACRAILAADKQSFTTPDTFRHAIQHAYYQQAKNPSLIEVLIQCAEQLPLDIDQFKHDLLSQTVEDTLTEHRQFAQQLGVSSYPSLRLVCQSDIHIIPHNYREIESTLEQINTLVNNQTKETIQSPCIRNCCLDAKDICLGCFRSLEEIKNWTYFNTSEKKAILNISAQRKANC